ncbi:hypothetical protein Cgig2_003399 [Carnegiea gigantea]|uniref:Uncharacterized protein n=1 Tax=Carnegiea gigantea TaxID=171969 RepID=A0A9Q1Q525_9CARY|nr:hypothetical protein Cgig2_003399 [Carnegiea gigantea]
MIHAIFYAMAVNDALKLGVMSRDMAGALKSALEGTQASNVAGILTIEDSRRAHGRRVFRRRGCAHKKPVPKVVAEGMVFPGAPERSNLQDGLSTHFSNPKVVLSLKRLALEKYLLPAGYKFISDADATVNKLPSKCIAIYGVALSSCVRFPVHPVIVEILNKLTCAGCAFGLVHMVQRAPSETGGLVGGSPGLERREAGSQPVRGANHGGDEDRLLLSVLPAGGRSSKGDPVRHVLNSGRGKGTWSQTEQARAMLSPFQSGQATEQEIVAKNERRREEEIVETQARKSKGIAGSSPQRLSRECSSLHVALGSPTVAGSWEIQQVAPRAFEEPSVNNQAQAMGFLAADRSAKERVLEAEKGDLQRHLEEARSKAEAEAAAGAEKAAKAEQQGYWLGHEDRTEFFRELLVVLAPDAFRQESYFEPYVKYAEDLRQAQAKGRNLELVDFIPLATDDGDLGDEETTLLDGGAATSDGEGHEDEAHGDIDDDEDSDI